ncbi:MAG: GAF and ANTAR domain-containing protein [Nocardioidaceae bacterium]
MPRRDVADALAAAVRTMSTPVTLAETLDGIVRAARDSVPGIDHAALSRRREDGTLETIAADDDLARRLDTLQHAHADGPVVQAMASHGTLQVDHAVEDPRWPAFLPLAVGLGVRSQLGIALVDGGRVLGALSLYSVTHDVLPADAAYTAELFATHATLALSRARTEDELRAAISTGQVIGQAIGIVMERYGLDEERAFGFLTRSSQAGNIKLRDIARELVDAANRSASAPVV